MHGRGVGWGAGRSDGAMGAILWSNLCIIRMHPRIRRSDAFLRRCARRMGCRVRAYAFPNRELHGGMRGVAGPSRRKRSLPPPNRSVTKAVDRFPHAALPRRWRDSVHSHRRPRASPLPQRHSTALGYHFCSPDDDARHELARPPAPSPCRPLNVCERVQASFQLELDIWLM